MAAERRVDYREIIRRGFNRADLPAEFLLGFEAVDLVVLAMEEDPWFADSFEKRRVKLEDVMTSVYDLDSLIAALTMNCDSSSAEGKNHLQALGQRALKHIENGIGDHNGLVAPAVREKLRNFILEEGHFHIALPDPK